MLTTFGGAVTNVITGYILSEYLASTNLEVVNQGSEPTFCVGNKQTVIDVTLASRPMDQEIFNWKVKPEDTFSDHRKIQFTMKQDKRPSTRRRHIKRTNWDVCTVSPSRGIGRHVRCQYPRMPKQNSLLWSHDRGLHQF